jgi:hypothetical protein
MDSLTTTPAFVRSADFEVLASNEPARQLTSAFEVGTNLLRATFFDPSAKEWLPHWVDATDQVAALVLDEAAQTKPTPDLRHLVGELASKSDRFAQALADDLLVLKPGMPMKLTHPQRGLVNLSFQQLRLPDDHQTLVFVGIDAGASGSK